MCAVLEYDTSCDEITAFLYGVEELAHICELHVPRAYHRLSCSTLAARSLVSGRRCMVGKLLGGCVMINPMLTSFMQPRPLNASPATCFFSELLVGFCHKHNSQKRTVNREVRASAGARLPHEAEDTTSCCSCAEILG